MWSSYSRWLTLTALLPILNYSPVYVIMWLWIKFIIGIYVDVRNMKVGIFLNKSFNRLKMETA